VILCYQLLRDVTGFGDRGIEGSYAILAIGGLKPAHLSLANRGLRGLTILFSISYRGSLKWREAYAGESPYYRPLEPARPSQ
jgi:hypothetical protein